MKTKIDAVNDALDSLEQSWSWKLLTDKEKEMFKAYLNLPSYYPQGTYKQAYRTVMNYYQFFLFGIKLNDTKGRLN